MASTDSDDIFRELEHRIEAHADSLGGVLPERAAIAWHGYLAAMIEWGLLSVAQHEALIARLPRIDDDPALGILVGSE